MVLDYLLRLLYWMAGVGGKGAARDGVLSFGWIRVLCVFGCLLDLGFGSTVLV